MFYAIGLQVAAVTILALGAGLLSDWASAGFVALGGAVAIFPNSLFAMRLAIHRGKSAESYPVIFFLGEFAKIGLTIGLLAAVIKWLPDIRWLPMIIGFIAALKAPLFALAIAPRQAPRTAADETQ